MIPPRAARHGPLLHTAARKMLNIPSSPTNSPMERVKFYSIAAPSPAQTSPLPPSPLYKKEITAKDVRSIKPTPEMLEEIERCYSKIDLAFENHKEAFKV